MAFYYVALRKNEDGSYESVRAPVCAAFRSRFDAEEAVYEWNKIAEQMAVPWRYLIVEVEHDE